MPEPDQYPPTLPDGRPPSSADASTPIEAIGEYELLAELAQGGMGIVYRARQRSLNRTVALKMLLPGRVVSDIGRARFRAEAEATAELDHPNIIPIFEVGEHTGRPFFSMKLIDGGTFADLLHKTPKPPLRDLIAILVKVCRAVHYAHMRGILHRDLKPSNVLLDAAGEPFVADFGLAKRLGSDDGLTATGALLGTPAYMAPEQAGDSGHGVTTLTDVYALGAILYEVLAGRPPFTNRDINLLLGQIRGELPLAPSSVCPDTPRDLNWVALKALAKEPSQRYASAGELADELERWLRGEPVLVRAPGLLSRIVLWARHNSRAAFWVTVIGVVWGVFGPQLPITLSIFGHLFKGMARTMSTFSSHPTHTLLRWDGTVPAGLFFGLLLLAAVLHLSVGMLTYLATRSRDQLAHLAGAAAVGLIGSVVAFTLYLGPVTMFSTAIVRTHTDLMWLGSAYPTREVPTTKEGETPRPHPQDELVKRYPELANVPEYDRGSLLAGKILTENMLGMYEGLLLGMLLTLVYALPVAVGGTSLAGLLVRRWGSPKAALVAYLEVSMAVSIGWFQAIALILAKGWGIESPGIGFEGWLFTLFLLTVPPYVVLRGWYGRDRWRIYSLGLGAAILLHFWNDDEHGLRWLGLTVFVVAVLFTARQWLGGHSIGGTPTRPTATPADRTLTHEGTSGE